MVLDPNVLWEATTSSDVLLSSLSSSLSSSSSSLLMAFTDQGQNWAGLFFQASLLPYLLFLYFLAFRGNQIPSLTNFGFQFILLFVVSTIPAGILSKSVYGTSLANVDYLHGGAELLLTVANILIVLGFKETMTKGGSNNLNNDDDEQQPPVWFDKPRQIALATAAGFAVLCALGPTFLTDAHSPFLFGLGAFPDNQVLQFPWVSHSEPVNALSIPTWLIHFSSVLEYWIAMGLAWQFASVTGNERWKGLTWGMLPLHASGICACTYHFFYNAPNLQFLVTAQAGLTLLGNLTLLWAAYRIAASNGWSPQELLPSPNQSTSPKGLVADGLAMKPLTPLTSNNLVPLPGIGGWVVGPTTSNVDLALNLGAATVALSYLVKYGSLGLDAPFLANPFLATAMIVTIPGVTAYSYYLQSKAEQGGEWNPFADFKSSSPQAPAFLAALFPGDNANQKSSSSLTGGGMPSLSMADIKKYGAAGTVAYVLTELAFWAVAFPVASYALYQSTGHWPDVVNDTTDRAAVLAFIFAGANIARALVPLRLGAALALAPWVDDNILGPIQDRVEEQSKASKTTTTPMEPQIVMVNQEKEENDEEQGSMGVGAGTKMDDFLSSTKDSVTSKLESAKGWFSSLTPPTMPSFSAQPTTKKESTTEFAAKVPEAAAPAPPLETQTMAEEEDEESVPEPPSAPPSQMTTLKPPQDSIKGWLDSLASSMSFPSMSTSPNKPTTTVPSDADSTFSALLDDGSTESDDDSSLAENVDSTSAAATTTTTITTTTTTTLSEPPPPPTWRRTSPAADAAARALAEEEEATAQPFFLRDGTK
ncbi:hypothetical protein ACA910_007527 [Epithemia clementina (nom. ined.)]